MNSIIEKEKKLNVAIEKLNLINPDNLNLKDIISNLDDQKNQLEIEKKEITDRYEELVKEHEKIKEKLYN